MRAELVDRRLGPVERLLRTDGLPLPLAAADFTVDGGRQHGGYGRGSTVAEAERTALFEAVERQLGMRPHARRTALTASFDELGPDRAVDPATLGLPDPRYHAHPGYRLTPYHPGVPTRWVYGWSLSTGAARAVPEHVAYWGIRPAPDAPRFLDESSNGCGLGNSIEEAALYGLLEVAERDAFLMAWYARTPLRRVAVPDDDPMVPHLVDRLDPLGYDLMFFDASNDFGLPAVVSLALHRDPGSAAPQAHFAAGAHPDPRTALRSAAAEVAVAVYAVAASIRQHPDHLDRDRVLRMLADPTEVRTIDDHVALYTLPEARPRYEFLLDGDDPVDCHELWPDRPQPVTDLTRFLTDLVGQLADAGMETIVVDQTDPWTQHRLGLHAAKVIVPGSLPMTFGHVYQRTRNLPRLLHTPVRLGRASTVLDYADLALHPHPFP
jgi:ribosomal protein S12 methylthiotransferase accessory factor